MGNYEFAFTGRFGDAPLARNAMATALRGTKKLVKGVKVTRTPGICELLGLAPFTPHDLRRTAATMCGELGLSESGIALCLDHQANKDENGKPLPAVPAGSTTAPHSFMSQRSAKSLMRGLLRSGGSSASLRSYGLLPEGLSSLISRFRGLCSPLVRRSSGAVLGTTCHGRGAGGVPNTPPGAVWPGACLPVWPALQWHMPEPTRHKITFGEMRAGGVRGLLVDCSNYHCSHWTAISGDRWPDLHRFIR